MHRFKSVMPCLKFVLLGVVILVGIYLRIQWRIAADFVGDELYFYSNVKGALKPFWQQITYGEVMAFPGQYLSVWPFVQMSEKLNFNVFVAVIPHILACLASYFFLYCVCRKLLNRYLSILIVFGLYSFHPEFIVHAFELRPYAVLPLISLVSFCSLDRMILGWGAFSVTKKLMFIALFLCMTFYHFYGIIIIGFCAFYFFLQESYRIKSLQWVYPFFPYIGGFLVIALPVILWYMGSTISLSGLEMHTFEYIPNPMVDFVGFGKAIAGNLMGYKMFYPLLLGVPLAFFVSNRNRIEKLVFAVVLIGLPICFLLFTAILKGYWFLQRQFIWVTPFFLVFVGWCWDTIFCFIGNKFKKMGEHETTELV